MSKTYKEHLLTQKITIKTKNNVNVLVPTDHLLDPLYS